MGSLFPCYLNDSFTKNFVSHSYNFDLGWIYQFSPHKNGSIQVEAENSTEPIWTPHNPDLKGKAEV